MFLTNFKHPNNKAHTPFDSVYWVASNEYWVLGSGEVNKAFARSTGHKSGRLNCTRNGGVPNPAERSCRAFRYVTYPGDRLSVTILGWESLEYCKSTRGRSPRGISYLDDLLRWLLAVHEVLINISLKGRSFVGRDTPLL